MFTAALAPKATNWEQRTSTNSGTDTLRCPHTMGRGPAAKTNANPEMDESHRCDTEREKATHTEYPL